MRMLNLKINPLKTEVLLASRKSWEIIMNLQVRFTVCVFLDLDFLKLFLGGSDDKGSLAYLPSVCRTEPENNSNNNYYQLQTFLSVITP